MCNEEVKLFKTLAECPIALKISSFSKRSLYIPKWSNFIGLRISCIFSLLPDPKGIVADITSQEEHQCNILVTVSVRPYRTCQGKQNKTGE